MASASIDRASPRRSLFSLVDVKVDSEQDERPERDGKDSGQHGLSRLDVREVVVGRRDDQPDHKVDDSDEADPQLDPPAGHEHDDPKKWHLVSAVRSKICACSRRLINNRRPHS